MTNDRAAEIMQAIIFMLGREYYTDEVEEAIHMAINALTAQNETHEERTETHACDLIDRQAAIDAIDEIRHVLDTKEKQLTILPSAQPEIVRCKDCKYQVITHGYITIRRIAYAVRRLIGRVIECTKNDSSVSVKKSNALVTKLGMGT